MLEEGANICATGRRKSSVARVRLLRGSGQVRVNTRELEEYFPIERHQAAVLAPLKVTRMLGKFDIIVKVKGGGPTGQSGAITLGVARALREVGGELESILRAGGYLTRDSRMVERKKYGRRGARRRFQFSKR